MSGPAACMAVAVPVREPTVQESTRSVINGTVAGPSDCSREPSHTMQLFRHKFDAELVKQSTRMCFPDPSMPFTDCVFAVE